MIWCGSTHVKHDDIGSGPENGDEEEVYDGVYGCGDAIGPITFDALKSGSQKHKKHHADYTPPADLSPDAPSGSGLFVADIPGCPLAPEQVPVPGECDAEPVECPPPPTEG